MSKVRAVTLGDEDGKEFVVHVPDEYDYRYTSVKEREIILFILCRAY